MKVGRWPVGGRLRSGEKEGGLVAQLGQLLCRLTAGCALLCLGELSPCSLLSLVICGALDLSSLLESVVQIIVSISHIQEER